MSEYVDDSWQKYDCAEPVLENEVERLLLTTPNGEFYLASPFIRLVARLLDLFFVIATWGATLLVAGIFFGPILEEYDWSDSYGRSGSGYGLNEYYGGIYFFLVLGLLVLILAYYVILTARGATIGKRIMGLRVVREDGGNLGLLRAFLREIIGTNLSKIFFPLAYLGLWSAQRQSWHDKLADSFVVMARPRSAFSAAINMKGASMSQVNPPVHFTPVNSQVRPRQSRFVTQIKSPRRVVLVALGLGWAADILFYNNIPGISVLLFVLLLLVTLFGLGQLEKSRPLLRNLWIILPLLFFSTMIFVRANGILTFLNIVAVLCLLGLLVFFYAADKIDRLGIADYPVVLLQTFGQVLARPAPVVGQGIDRVMVHRHRFRLAVPLLRGFIIAVPVLLVFTALLSSADSVFADYVDKISQLKFLSNAADWFWQLWFILIVAWVVAGGLLFSLSRQPGAEDGNARTAVPGVLTLFRRVGFVEGATVLFLVDLLFVAFAWIQFTYLFSGQAASRMNYAVYRDYVRRGFGELLLASVLTLILIVGMRWITRHDTKRELLILNSLSSLMIGLALIMLYSSFQRMLTWENVEYYINTDIRLYVRAFMAWLGLTFGWLALTLWVKPDRFAIGLFVAVLGWLVTVNLVNPDADVAAYNLAHYHGTQSDLATRYLGNLSDDAMPVLADSLSQTTGEVQRNLRSELENRLYKMEIDKSWQDWPSFHLARWQAYDLLTVLRKDGKISYPPSNFR